MSSSNWFQATGKGLAGWRRTLAVAAGVTGVLLTLAVVLGPLAQGSTPAESTEASQNTSAPKAERASRAETTSTASPTADDPDLPHPDELSRVFIQVAEKVKPSVVNISTEQVVQGPTAHPPLGSPFDDFFERFFGAPGQQRRRSLGSGVIVDPRGYILTNNHVVERADQIEVDLSDGSTHKAKVVGTDPPTDLAVIQIESEGNFPAAPLGDSSSLVVGEWVLAIGNPFGFGHTVTAGIVSAKGRVIGQGNYDDFVQTDAAINPGNSGGPLVNMRGEVIGINTSIISASGGSMGIGFATPSSMAAKIYDQLVEFGSVTRGWLGVSIQNLTPELARNFGIEGKTGAVVGDVIGDDSPAGNAGLKAGDVIVEIDGKPVESNHDLVQLVADIRPESTVNVKFYRDGKLQTTQVTLGKRESETVAREMGDSDESERGRLGITAQTLTSSLASQMGITSRSGVVIVEVDPSGPAAEAGLQQGDVIIEANRQQLTSVDDLQEIIRDVPSGGDLLLRIERASRRGQSSFLWVVLQLT